MASQNIIEILESNGHKVKIYQDVASKYRWRAMNSNVDNVGSSEQGFSTLELCRQNLQNLAEVIGNTFVSNGKYNDVGTSKVEATNNSEKNFDSGLNSVEEERAMDWNIFWLVVLILLLSIFIFTRIFLFR